MGEAVDASLDQVLGVGVVEDVRDDLEPVPVSLLDDGAIVRRVELLDRAAAIVHPDFDERDVGRREVADVLAPLVRVRDAERRWT